MRHIVGTKDTPTKHINHSSSAVTVFHFQSLFHSRSAHLFCFFGALLPDDPFSTSTTSTASPRFCPGGCATVVPAFLGVAITPDLLRLSAALRGVVSRRRVSRREARLMESRIFQLRRFARMKRTKDVTTAFVSNVAEAAKAVSCTYFRR